MTRDAGNRLLLRSSAMAPALALAACGGGGGGRVVTTPDPVQQVPAPTPTPTPTPTPAPTPAPSPTPTPMSSYDTSEYRATVGAVSLNALAAYNVGATGKGVSIGIIDSGIDLQSAEFGDRVSAASRDVAGNSSVDDQAGHGTAVAFTAAGRRNGAGTQGVAFDATLVVLRADRPGTCTTADTDDSDPCKFSTVAIGQGIDAAREAGAKVINLSLGGAAMPQELMQAVNRATAAGIILVIAAGNDYADNPSEAANPDPFAQVASNDGVARNLVIIAGSVGSSDQISAFSNRAGSFSAHYLTAVGERVRAPDNNDTPYLWSGTSFSAPQISGAIALLAQAFPNLTGSQIVDILYRTARDAGAAGVDPVYGNGVIDLTRAFQPVGTTLLAGTKTAVSLTSNATLSAPMGDAAVGTLGAVVLDSYRRAFAMDLGGTIRRRGPRPAFGGALQTRQRSVAVARGGMTVSMTLAPRGNGAIAVERTTLSDAQAVGARAIAGQVTQRLGEKAAFGFAFSQGGGQLTAQLAGQREPAFLVAVDGGAGFDIAPRAASAYRQQVKGFGLTAAIESGDVVAWRDPALTGLTGYRRSGYDRVTLALDRRVGDVSTVVSATRMAEDGTLLGARFDWGLGGARADSWFLDAKARWAMGDGWTLGGTMRRGWTAAGLRGALSGLGTVRTGAFAADVGKDGMFGTDSIGLRIAQPLRVSRGGIDYALPTGYDYSTLAVTGWTMQRLNLAPTGREIDVEARYSVVLPGGDVQANLFWRRNPGNIAALPADYGLAVRYGVGF